MAVRVEHGDCLEVMAALAAEGVQIDACVTDAPYHLTSIVKRFGAQGAAPAKEGTDGAFARASRGFMGKTWDGGDIAFRPETWRLVYDLLKPGAYIMAFGGSRTFHRMGCAIEDAGFIPHPLWGWIFGQGFPKAHNPKIPGMEGWRYGGQTAKPALEPIFMGQKPFEGKARDSIVKYGCGALNVAACKVHADDAQGGEYVVRRLKPGATLEKTGGSWRSEDGPDNRGHLTPGRWPANLVHDGSDEVVAAFPESPGQLADASTSASSRKRQNVYGAMKRGNGREGEDSAERRYTEEGSTNFSALPGERRNDSGSAARFFYCAKADADDRFGSKHPTVKPVDLIAYLCRLVTPPGGTVLDPFAGSGTTGAACIREGFNSILIEREDEYVADIRARLAALEGEGPTAPEARGRNVTKKPLDGLLSGIE